MAQKDTSDLPLGDDSALTVSACDTTNPYRPDAPLGDQDDSDSQKTLQDSACSVAASPVKHALPDEAEASETTPLILRSLVTNDRERDESESLILIKFSLPIYCTQIIECTFYVVNMISVGQLGVTELAATALGSMTANLLGITVIIGFVGALDTLCPQAWTSDPKSMGLHCQRVAAILSCMLVPQMLLFWHAGPIFLLLGQEPAIANLVGLYLKIVACGLPGIAGFEVIRRWLQSQGIMHAPTMVLVAAAPLNIGLNYLLVWSPIGYGFAGAPTAMAVTPYFMFLASFSYCYFFAPRNGWDGLKMAALEVRHWGEPFRLGCSTMMFVVAEWWAWEALTLSVSPLGSTILATQAALGSTQFVTYINALSISSAASIRVGNLIGAQQTKQAVKAARTALGLGLCSGLCTTALLFAVRPVAGKVFSRDPAVLALYKEILPIVAAYQIFDSVAGVCFGILRGSGRSHIAALITGTAYWVVGIPTSLCLVYLTPLKLAGLWLAIALSLVCTSVLCTAYIWRIDFSADARKALERAVQTSATNQGPREA